MKRPADSREAWDDEIYAPDPRAEPDIPAILFAGWFLVAALIIGLALMFFAFAAARDVKAQEDADRFHSNPSLLTWIPSSCCVTNDCCWEISERELTPMPGDRWMVNATEQVLPRTGWSPDGKFYRCACDLNNGKWVRHQGANTRCVFVAMRSARR